MADLAQHNNPDEDVVEDADVAIEGGAPRLQHVEVRTGEENFDEVCKIKAKIWRFDEGENQWKERGQGDAKILRAKADPKRHIFLFRREAIGKLAAHHAIVNGMRLKPVQNNDKKFIWGAPKDCTDDEEGYPELFTIKFGDESAAAEFKRHFEAAAAINTNN